MQFSRADIKNFRSIKNETIRFDPSCRVLVGINESGKSNILHALSLLSDNYAPSKANDLREALPDEPPVSDSSVMFVFTLEKQDQDVLFSEVSSKILSKQEDPDIAILNGKTLSVKGYCLTRNEGLYTVNILKETKNHQYWIGTFKLLGNWKKPSSSCPPEFTIELEGSSYKLSDYKLIAANDFENIPSEYLADAKIEDLTSLSGNVITELVQNNMPDVLLWIYDEMYLLPNAVNIPQFCGNPDSCIPLKNMFLLAGITDIAASVNSARSRGHNQFQNYLDGIANKTTKHFRDVWKEYDGIEFSLHVDGDNIIPGVKEINTLDFAKRSDGFKRFVTFLLIISVNVKTDNIKDTLLLIDEPEIGLHPSGARYLRDELIKISNTNYVIYSTHSIFMIDSGQLDRHYIVKKKNEITDLSIAKDSNIADEEVLYNALGHSVFAVLKEKNIIFEGWNDKYLFRLGLKNASATLNSKFSEYGVCHAKGVGTIKTITPMIELAGRECVIISDSDKPAKNQKKEYRQQNGYGKWLTYQDLDSSITSVTGEDFIKNDYLAKQVNSALLTSGIPKIDEEYIPSSDKLASILNWLTTNGIEQNQAKDIIKKIKSSIFDKLSASDIETSYMKLIKGLSSKF